MTKDDEEMKIYHNDVYISVCTDHLKYFVVPLKFDVTVVERALNVQRRP